MIFSSEKLRKKFYLLDIRPKIAGFYFLVGENKKKETNNFIAIFSLKTLVTIFFLQNLRDGTLLLFKTCVKIL